jgi:hypothetical protein
LVVCWRRRRRQHRHYRHIDDVNRPARAKPVQRSPFRARIFFIPTTCVDVIVGAIATASVKPATQLKKPARTVSHANETKIHIRNKDESCAKTPLPTGFMAKIDNHRQPTNIVLFLELVSNPLVESFEVVVTFVYRRRPSAACALGINEASKSRNL